MQRKSHHVVVFVIALEHFIEAKPLISEKCGARVQAPWKVSPPDEKS